MLSILIFVNCVLCPVFLRKFSSFHFERDNLIAFTRSDTISAFTTAFTSAPTVSLPSLSTSKTSVNVTLSPLFPAGEVHIQALTFLYSELLACYFNNCKHNF